MNGPQFDLIGVARAFLISLGAGLIVRASNPHRGASEARRHLGYSRRGIGSDGRHHYFCGHRLSRFHSSTA